MRIRHPVSARCEYSEKNMETARRRSVLGAINKVAVD